MHKHGGNQGIVRNPEILAKVPGSINTVIHRLRDCIRRELAWQGGQSGKPRTRQPIGDGGLG